MQNIIDDKRDLVESIFETITPRTEQTITDYKQVWVRCRGISLSKWNT